MRRSLAVLLWILIGAIASGAGMSFALHRSNEDRVRLTRLTEEANARATSFEKLSTELGASMRLATEEVGRTQLELDRLRGWQTQLKDATPLVPLRAAQTKGWSEFASVPLGVSIRIPPGMQANTSDDGVFLKTLANQHGRKIEEQWLGMSRYNPERQQDIYTHSHTNSSGSVRYVLSNRLFTGTVGTFADTLDQKIYILSIQENASSTYLLWAKTVDGVSERTILDTLATLSFR
jgi:hypothetical protein